MPTIRFTDDLMELVDPNGYGVDAWVVDPGDPGPAYGAVESWAADHGLDPRPARQALGEHIAEAVGA